MTNLNQKIVSGATWQLVERFSTLGLQFVVSIIMARLIAPEIYGMIALMAVFSSLATPFIDGGFGMALIQRDKIDDLDCSTVFWFNFIMSVIFFVLIWVFAPRIAAYYHEPDMVTPLRVYELVLLISSLTIVHFALLNRNMEFKKNFAVTWVSLIASSVVGIVWAYLDPSVWALIGSMLISSVVRMIAVMVKIRWKPRFSYSWARFRLLFSYSSKLLGNTMLSVFSRNYTALLIGRFFGSADIAFYTRGRAYPELATCVVDGTLSKVLFPVFSKKQGEAAELLRYCRLSLSTSFSVMFPLLILMSVVAEPLVRLMLTERWLPCVPFLRITCAICLLWVLSGITQQCMNGRGNSGVVLSFRIVTTAVSLVILTTAARFGLINMLIISTAASYGMMIFFVKISERYIGLSVGMLAGDLWKPFLAGTFAGAAALGVLMLSHAHVNDILQVLVSSLAMVVVYVLLAFVFKLEIVSIVLKLMRKGTVK